MTAAVLVPLRTLAELRGARVAAPRGAHAPGECGGLLGGSCHDPGCVAADIAEQARLDRWEDQ